VEVVLLLKLFQQLPIWTVVKTWLDHLMCVADLFREIMILELLDLFVQVQDKFTV